MGLDSTWRPLAALLLSGVFVAVACQVDDRRLVTGESNDGSGGTSSGTRTNSASSGPSAMSATGSGGLSAGNGSGTTSTQSGASTGGADGGSGGSDSTGGNGNSGTAGTGGTDSGEVQRTCTPVLATSTTITSFTDWSGQRWGGTGIDGTLSGGIFLFGEDDEQTLTLEMDIDTSAGLLNIAGSIESYGGFGLWWDVRQGDGFGCNDCCVDASDCEGISFEIVGSDVPVQLRPRLQNHSTMPREGEPPRGGCLFESEETKYQECVYPSGPTIVVDDSPTTVRVPFSDFDSGRPSVEGGAHTEIIGLQWEFDWKPGTTDPYPVDVTISNIQFYGGDECGSAEPVIPEGACAPILSDAEVCAETAVATGSAPLIEDFEDGDDVSPASDGRSGGIWWWSGDDDADTVVSPPLGALVVEDLETPRGDSTRAFHTSGTTDSWGAVAGVRLAEWIDESTLACYDATAYTGISFWARGEGRLELKLGTAVPKAAAQGGACTASCTEADCKCCNTEHVAHFTVSDEWQRYSARWDDLTVVYGAQSYFDEAELVTLAFGFNGPTWDIWIDDIEFTK